MKTKRMTRVLVMVLVLAMVLSVSALAAWPVYGGSNSHNAVVTNAPTNPSTSSLTSYVSLTNSTSWDGVDNVPVMETVNNVTYAYVLYDGLGTNGAQVIKYNCTNGGEIWRTTAQQTQGSLNAKAGFQLSTPYLDTTNRALYVGVISAYTYDPATDAYLQNSNSKLVKLTNLDASQPTVTEMILDITGQINTPITSDGTYLYFGTWPGGTNAGTYYQVKISDGTYKTYTPSANGFYWAGAVKSGNYIYFGSDNGQLHYRRVSTFNSTGGVVNLAAVQSDAGNVRSTIMEDNGYLYFTSQGGYLWCYKAGSTGTPTYQWHTSLGATSTSTPTKVGNRIYVGCYSGFSAGGVKCVDATTHVATNVATGFPVQCSIVVMGNGTGTDYLYFNTNSGSGAGYCYSYNGTTGAKVWSTDSDTYALGGMACTDGYIVFGNDKNHLYIVH